MKTGANNSMAVNRSVARHAFGWLAAANAVGVLLAALLLWPELNGPLAPLTYGRWFPLHLDWQLYGWCSLPLVGVLLAWCLDLRRPAAVRDAGVALWAWSGALALGGLAWLGGVSSGKMFLEWHGWDRPWLPLAMTLLWGLLAKHVWCRRERLDGRGRWVRCLGLAVLVVVPGALYWASGREVYPSVNPDSGGATGARLLLSTLGIVAIYGFIAEVLGFANRNWRRWYWTYFIGSALVCGGIEHGNSSHHETAQFIGLATLLGWLPIGFLYFRGPIGLSSARRWWMAAFIWWVGLVLSGLWVFLPGISERLKFTNGMVGHAHLAMAGLVTSANLAVLVELRAWNGARWFWLWQGAAVTQVVVLFVLGWGEAGNAAEFFLSGSWEQTIYAVRFVAGLALFFASWSWWRDAAQPKGGSVAP